MIDSRWQTARRILVVRLDNMGDVLLATPSIHAVKAALPEAQVTLLTSPVGSQVGRLNPDISEVITYEAPWVDPWQRLPHDPAREQAMIASLRAGQYDAAIIFSSYHQSPLPAAYACYLAGIPLRLAASIDGPGSLLTTRHKHPAGMMHEVERGLDLVSAIGIPPADLDLVLAVPQPSREHVAEWLREVAHPMIVVHPGCSMPARTYSWKQYAEVVDRLVDQLGARVILTGAAGEEALVGNILERLGPQARRYTTPAAGVLAFPEFCALIETADLVVTNNTGPMHIAAAAKTPVVALFALTNPPDQWRPWRVRHRLLYHDVACRLCYSRVCPVGHDCLRLVTAEDVAAAAADLLKIPPTPTPPSRRVQGSQVGDQRKEIPLCPQNDRRGAISTTGLRPRKIAVLRALYLGDLLCATPALRALRHRFPHAEITLIGLPWVRQLIERLPSVDRFEPFPGYPGLPEVPFEPPATIAFLEWARQRRFDLAVQMHGSGPASNEFVSELRSGMSLGFRRDRGDPLTVGLPWQEDEHEVYRWLRLVGELGADADPTLDFPISPLEMTAADKLLGYQTVSGERLIGLHVGAKDPARRWPPARFAALADRLTRAIDCRFVLTGTSAEQKLVDEAAQAMAAPGLNLVGQTNLGTLAGVLGRLDLLVTNDTGASHLAEAVGTPSVVLFGPTAPARWAPLDQRLHCPVDARGVNGSTRDGAAALANLPIDPVFSACVEQLAMRDERTAEQLVDDAAVGSAREALCRA